MIYIVSAKNTGILKRSICPGNKKSWIEFLPQLPKGFKPQSGDQVYLDIAGIDSAKCKKYIKQFKANGYFFGIIDPKGIAADPALYFFRGASDYIGQAQVKKGIGKKRFTEALSWTCEKTSDAGTVKNETPGNGKAAKKAETTISIKNHKPVSGKFEGWNSIRSGATGSFFFLFISLSGKSNLRAMLGETTFILLHNRLREVLQQSFGEADALIWMEAEGNSLLLVPPKLYNGRAAVITALKTILNSRLICMEKLGLTIPAEFTFALHYGQTIYQAPGKTGEVISESVNYIFHLGIKKAQAGRLTISGAVPDEVIPEGLADLFTPAGSFEGLKISQSRRFV